MNRRIDYKKIIEDIEKNDSLIYTLDQNKAKKLVNDEIPKSVFNETYIVKGNNALARYIMEKGYKFKVTKPQIIIYK